jgi:hypothetical protein
MRYLWEEEELEFLLNHVGQYPLKMLAAILRRQAKVSGWHLRTDYAVWTKLRREGISSKPIDDYISKQVLADILGFRYPALKSWHKRGQLKTRQCYGMGRPCVVLKDFREFAQNNPHLLTGADPDGLRFLLGEDLQDLATKIIKQTKNNRGRKIPLCHLPTGKTFPSVSAAARFAGISPTAMHHRLKRKNQREWKRMG